MLVYRLYEEEGEASGKRPRTGWRGVAAAPDGRRLECGHLHRRRGTARECIAAKAAGEWPGSQV